MGPEDRSRLLHRLDLEEPLAQTGRTRYALRVPAEVLAELERRLARVALQPEGEAGMLEGGGEPLLGRGGEPRGPAGDEVPGLREDPGLAERAPGDHDPGAVRVGPHRDDVFRGGDASVPDDRVFWCLAAPAHPVPLRRTGEDERSAAG